MSATGDDAAPSAQAGTTLVEALAVVAITALVAMIGFPRMQQGLLTLAQRQTVSAVAARLRQSRAEALRHDAPVIFTVAADGRAYGEPGGIPVPAPPGVTLSTSTGRIAFFGDGSSSGGLVWVSGGRRAIAVIVSAPAGAVAVGPG